MSREIHVPVPALQHRSRQAESSAAAVAGAPAGHADSHASSHGRGEGPEHGHARHRHVHDHAHGSDAAGSALGQPAPVLLFVAGNPISEAEIAREMQHHRSARPECARADAARALVVKELLRLEIERVGLAGTVTPVGRENAEEAAIRVLLERETPDRVPSLEDCRRYYQQNAARFHAPDRIRVRHILKAAPPDDVAARLAARTACEDLIVELKRNPVLFADFALRHSDCPSKEQGGDLGWLARGQTTPEFDRQVFRLGEGLAGLPMESRWGYHVVVVDAIERGQPLGFEDVRRQISDYLELQVRQQELQQYLLGLQERYDVLGLAEIEAAAG